MMKAISCQDIFIQAIKASIGNLIWMKYLRAFNKQDNGIILIPHIREIQRVTNDDALKAYLTSFFCDDFLENDTISQYQYLIETIPSKLDDAIWDSILFDVESKLIERIDRMFLSNTKDCLVFIERTKSSPLFFGEDFDQLICPFIKNLRCLHYGKILISILMRNLSIMMMGYIPLIGIQLCASTIH